MSFASSFAAGQKIGSGLVGTYDSADASRRQQVLDDRATTAYNQGQEDRTRTVGLRSQLDDAYKVQAGLSNGTVDGRTADFSGVSPAADQGPVQQSQMAPVVGLRAPGSDPSAPAPGLVRTPATQMDRLNAASTIANLKQDDAGIARIGAERQVMVKNASDRSYLARLTAMQQDPNQAEAYKNEIGPVMSALNGHEGIPANYHYDPKTKGIVQTPYGSVDPKTGQATYGAPQQMPFLAVASAALAMKNLTEENGGDPAAAAAQLKTMSDGERDRRLKEADSSVNNATSLSNAAAQQQQVEQQGAYQRGILAKPSGGSGGDNKVSPELAAEINGLVTQLNNAKDPREQQELRRKITNTQIKIATANNKVFVPKEDRPTAGTDPVKRLGLVKSLMEMQGVDYPTASASADAMLGGGSNAGGDDLVERLKQQAIDQKKNQNPRPIVIQPGENGMRTSGQAVMGDPKNFQRINSRGLFGGISYGYVDPVTNKKYSPEEYNRLLAE